MNRRKIIIEHLENLSLENINLQDKVIRLQQENQRLIKDYCRLDARTTTYQKEFIKYLKEEIKELKEIKEKELDCDILKDVIPGLLAYEEILSKYREIVGSDTIG